MEWDDFKTFVKVMRYQQNKLMKKQNGNRIMLSICVTDSDIYHSIYFMPHGIDLRTGEVFGLRDNGVFSNYNIKEVLESNEKRSQTEKGHRCPA